MQRYAFKMFLNPGQAHEYRRRHDAIWPELKALLGETGVRNYSIFLDPETNTLFAYLERPNDHGMDDAAAPSRHAALVGAHEGHHGRQPRRQPRHRPAGRDVSFGVRRATKCSYCEEALALITALFRKCG